MRHRVYGKHFGRNKDERKNLFKGLVQSLLSYGTIQTSEIKAKAIKGLVDKVINSVKKGTFSDDRDLKDRITQILPKLGNKTSGYTSVVRMGARLGDQTTIVKMSLIGAEELKPVESRVPLRKRSEASKGQESSEANEQELKVGKKVAKPEQLRKIAKTSVTKKGGKKS